MKTVRIGLAVLVLAALAIFVAVKVIGNDDDDSGDPAAVGLSQEELVAEAATLKHVAYWVGPQSGIDQYELSQQADGANIYVRYLTGGAEVGNSDPNYLTVGTYLVQDAEGALHRGAQGGTEKVKQEDGFSLLEGANNNVYVVFEDQPDLQLEIFSPEPGVALNLAKSGAVVPIQ